MFVMALLVRDVVVCGPKRGFGPAPPCICGSGLESDRCCERLVRDLGARRKATPGAIVRSRYRAYAKGAHAYLMDTTHELNSQYSEDRTTWRASLAQQPYGEYRFLGATILDETVDGDSAKVRFVAKLKLKTSGRRADFQELSYFKRTDDGWKYLGGDVTTAPVVDLKTGENADDLLGDLTSRS
ncbi:hypothetical protein CTAYLR_005953 [Chrysophaeum taylorii]|uniref:YchJ-like middle NTF2-like domain-containing protein n=1 Tax=Chrysophaeum taylorii TaxID=2483200 RepID=A0AAD7XS13_9STRA|nr:hypothetical protein CTAYLR_005953 [Chrysophaeum taylorii]